MQLRLMGFKFLVLPEGFITHHPHMVTEARKMFLDGREGLKTEMFSLFDELSSRLSRTYANRSADVTPRCRGRNHHHS